MNCKATPVKTIQTKLSTHRPRYGKHPPLPNRHHFLLNTPETSKKGLESLIMSFDNTYMGLCEDCEWNEDLGWSAPSQTQETAHEEGSASNQSGAAWTDPVLPTSFHTRPSYGNLDHEPLYPDPNSTYPVDTSWTTHNEWTAFAPTIATPNEQGLEVQHPLADPAFQQDSYSTGLADPYMRSDQLQPLPQTTDSGYIPGESPYLSGDTHLTMYNFQDPSQYSCVEWRNLGYPVPKPISDSLPVFTQNTDYMSISEQPTPGDHSLPGAVSGTRAVGGNSRPSKSSHISSGRGSGRNANRSRRSTATGNAKASLLGQQPSLPRLTGPKQAVDRASELGSPKASDSHRVNFYVRGLGRDNLEKDMPDMARGMVTLYRVAGSNRKYTLPHLSEPREVKRWACSEKESMDCNEIARLSTTFTFNMPQEVPIDPNQVQLREFRPAELPSATSSVAKPSQRFQAAFLNSIGARQLQGRPLLFQDRESSYSAVIKAKAKYGSIDVTADAHIDLTFAGKEESGHPTALESDSGHSQT
ncbi:hypothetical protein IAT40_003290 [Kwoniella sp. CBS 6097]